MAKPLPAKKTPNKKGVKLTAKKTSTKRVLSPKVAPKKKAAAKNLAKREKPPEEIELSSDDGPEEEPKAKPSKGKKVEESSPPGKAPKKRAPRKIVDPFSEEATESKHFIALLEAFPTSKGTLLDDLEAVMKKYIIPEKGKDKSPELTDMVRAKIDHFGLTGTAIMRTMSKLQMDLRLRPGFYKKLMGLDAVYNGVPALAEP